MVSNTLSLEILNSKLLNKAKKQYTDTFLLGDNNAGHRLCFVIFPMFN